MIYVDISEKKKKKKKRKRKRKHDDDKDERRLRKLHEQQLEAQLRALQMARFNVTSSAAHSSRSRDSGERDINKERVVEVK